MSRSEALIQLSLVPHLAEGRKEQNQLTKKILKHHGILLPDAFNTLTEKEQERRLADAVEELKTEDIITDLSDFDRENLRSILAGNGDWWTARLLRLIGKADSINRQRLFRGFPEEVKLVHQYQTGKEFTQ